MNSFPLSPQVLHLTGWASRPYGKGLQWQLLDASATTASVDSACGVARGVLEWIRGCPAHDVEAAKWTGGIRGSGTG